MSTLKRIQFEEVLAAAHMVWADKSTAVKIALETVEIISRVYKRKFMFINGKSSKGLVGGLFYLLGYRHSVVKKQFEIADKLGTTDVTIRNSYRQWLMEFPDLFLDVIAKFAKDDKLRYFVLLDLEQKRLQSQH